MIAFVPEASMGTAIEMWEAHEHGRAAVLTISPLDHNWAVRFCSHAIYPDFEAFENAVHRGEVQRTIERMLSLLVPLVTLVLGVLIAAIIGSMMAAILSSYDLPF